MVRGARPALGPGVGRVRSPVARLAVYALTAAGVFLLAWSGVLHIRLWTGGYATIPTIGPLFLAQGVAGVGIAAFLAVVRRVAVMAAGAVFLIATSAGLLLSAEVGLFGYRESLAVPYAGLSLVIEFTGTAVLLLAAAVTLRSARRR